MLRELILVLILLNLAIVSWADIKQDLKEVDEKFTYHGKHIHPKLVEEFNGWLSDSWIPTRVSVDVIAAADANDEYYDGDMKVEENGYIYHRQEGVNEYFYYKWLGRLNNGLHVLDVGEGGGGSGIFKSLFFVRFDIGQGYTPEGEKYDRLLMTIVRNFVLGDRDDGEIKVLQDKVLVGKSSYRDEPVVISFPSQ